MNKKALQIAIGILALIPLLTGGLDLILGATALNIVDGAGVSAEVLNNVVIDSQIRFLGAIWLGVGVLLYWMLPAIETQTTLFRFTIGSIILGGIGRLASAFLVGIPPIPVLGGIGLEVIGMPLLLLWQSRIAKPN